MPEGFRTPTSLGAGVGAFPTMKPDASGSARNRAASKSGAASSVESVRAADSSNGTASESPRRIMASTAAARTSGTLEDKYGASAAGDSAASTLSKVEAIAAGDSVTTATGERSRSEASGFSNSIRRPSEDRTDGDDPVAFRPVLKTIGAPRAKAISAAAMRHPGENFMPDECVLERGQPFTPAAGKSPRPRPWKRRN